MRSNKSRSGVELEDIDSVLHSLMGVVHFIVGENRSWTDRIEDIDPDYAQKLGNDKGQLQEIFARDFSSTFMGLLSVAGSRRNPNGDTVISIKGEEAKEIAKRGYFITIILSLLSDHDGIVEMILHNIKNSPMLQHGSETEEDKKRKAENVMTAIIHSIRMIAAFNSKLSDGGYDIVRGSIGEYGMLQIITSSMGVKIEDLPSPMGLGKDDPLADLVADSTMMFSTNSN
jgi:hypothetical protein